MKINNCRYQIIPFFRERFINCVKNFYFIIQKRYLNIFPQTFQKYFEWSGSGGSED